MNVISKGTFRRDVKKIQSQSLRLALLSKIESIESATDISRITGLKKLRGYSHHYRIIIKTRTESYRIGAMIRGDTIWLSRFLPRRIIYKQFP